jgi:hypothetical protein
MEGVHRYEGTVNQVMGDGIMALFGAPVAHEDHAVRACYAAPFACRRPSRSTRRASSGRVELLGQILQCKGTSLKPYTGDDARGERPREPLRANARTVTWSGRQR